MRTLKRLAKTMCIGLTAVFASGFAASAVTVTDTQVMTQNGQDFTFTFSGLTGIGSAGGTITVSNGLSLSNPINYDGHDIDSAGQSNEFFSVSLDGVNFGSFNCRGNGSNALIAGCTVRDNFDTTYSLEIDLLPGLLATALADGSVSILVAFSNGVGHFGDQDQLNVSLSYAEVPVPLTGLLLSTGLIGLFGMRSLRRRG